MRIQDAKTRYAPEVKNPENATPPVSTRLSIMSEEYRGEYHLFEIDKIQPYHNQARRYFDEEALNDMANTIRDYGLRQPLTVISILEKPGFYEVVSGERRLRAAKIAGLKKVPCIILENKSNAVEISLIENIHREDLSPLELGEMYSKIISEGIFSTNDELAKKIGSHKSTVGEYIALSSLNEDIKDLISKHKITSRKILREITRNPNIDRVRKLIGLDTVLDIVPESKPALPRENTSILKITLTEDGIKTNRNGLRLIPRDMIDQLKKELLGVINDLDKK